MVIPDFIIAGAMKCGTTSLHYILSKHPQIFIPDEEINFFDLDEFDQHKDFIMYKNGKWYYPNFMKNKVEYLQLV
ncbi:sulfotransferase [Fodinibius sp. AD559]|uniref:sulfotransferase n=1 Tax=Fodinibius sp. AD559 TaxID=3424179 RepID=UPI004046B42E